MISSPRTAPGWPLPSAFAREGKAPAPSWGGSFALHTFSLSLGREFHAVVGESVSVRAVHPAGSRLSRVRTVRGGPDPAPPWGPPGPAAGARPSHKEQRAPHDRPGPTHLGSDPRHGSAAENTRVTDRLLCVLKPFPLAYRHTKSLTLRRDSSVGPSQAGREGCGSGFSGT